MMTHTDHPAECTMCARFFASCTELKTHQAMHCHQEDFVQSSDTVIPTSVEEVSKTFTTCLDLTKKNKEDSLEKPLTTPIKVKLGFSIEDIMKR